MYKNAEEEMVICPYNRYHVVSKLRIQKHIVKCKKNYPDVKLSTCFYNYSHRMSPNNMLAHYGVCSHKTRIDCSRYEPNNSSKNSVKDDQQSRKFPDINVKPQFLCNHSTHSSYSLTQLSCENGDKLNSSGSDSDSENTFKIDYSDYNDDSDDDLEPLPLPKTVSKAFTCAKQKQDMLLPDTSPTMPQSKGFGRAKRFIECSPANSSRTTEQSVPDLRSFDGGASEKRMNAKVLSNNNTYSSSASVVSSMFDETSTFKSDEVIFDGDDSVVDNADFILKNFDKYTKI